MQVEIRRHAFEIPRAVEHHRAKPKCVRPRAPHPHVALMPGVIKKRPRLGPTVTRRHACPALFKICTAALEPNGVVSTAKRTVYYTSFDVKSRATTRQPWPDTLPRRRQLMFCSPKRF